jgi:hypothetical protein
MYKDLVKLKALLYDQMYKELQKTIALSVMGITKTNLICEKFE